MVIRNDKEHEKSLEKISKLMDKNPCIYSISSRKIDILSDAIVDYEEKILRVADRRWWGLV
jgi:antitoxin component HigA of HigAB toxin-antitoxin module